MTQPARCPADPPGSALISDGSFRRNHVQWRGRSVAIPRAVGAWRATGAKCLCLLVALILQSACVRPPMLGFSSLSVGEWEGTTSQGKPITFTVSPDEKVTSIIVGYGF